MSDETKVFMFMVIGFGLFFRLVFWALQKHKESYMPHCWECDRLIRQDEDYRVGKRGRIYCLSCWYRNDD